jgi:hypothetical protein
MTVAAGNPGGGRADHKKRNCKAATGCIAISIFGGRTNYLSAVILFAFWITHIICFLLPSGRKPTFLLFCIRSRTTSREGISSCLTWTEQEE